MSHQAALLRFAALATDLAGAAKDNAKRAGVPALVSESAVMEARGLALMSDAQGCLTALRESEQTFAAAENRDRPEWLAYFDGAYLAAKFGHCFRDLGRPIEAERFARRSLDMIDGYDRGRLFNLALLASILADQARVEEACETGLTAVHLASKVQSVRTVAYLVDLSHRLAPFRAEPEIDLQLLGKGFVGSVRRGAHISSGYRQDRPAAVARYQSLLSQNDSLRSCAASSGLNRRCRCSTSGSCR